MTIKSIASFLGAAQRVVDSGSLVTLVAIPKESALDDGAVPDFNDDTNRKNSRTYDDVVERVCDEAGLIINELDIDIDLKTRERYLRSTVPVGSTTLNGIINPALANREYSDESV